MNDIESMYKEFDSNIEDLCKNYRVKDNIVSVKLDAVGFGFDCYGWSIILNTKGQKGMSWVDITYGLYDNMFTAEPMPEDYLHIVVVKHLLRKLAKMNKYEVFITEKS